MKPQRTALAGLSALLALVLQVALVAPASAAPPERTPYSCTPGSEFCMEGVVTTHTTVNQNNITTVTRDDYRLTVTFGDCVTVQEGSQTTLRHTPIDANGIPEHDHGLHYKNTSAIVSGCAGTPAQECQLSSTYQIIDGVYKQERFDFACEETV